MQVQALVNHYKIRDLLLIILDNNRVQPWLIDDELYDAVIVLPGIEKKRWKRLLKSHIESYRNILLEKLKERDFQIFIGAQDENTLYTVIKMLASPESYWNIEDGFANYYNRNFSHKLGIWLKKKLFKYAYGYNLNIAYAHGQVNCERSFRIAPEISTGNNKHKKLAPILKNYLLEKVNNERSKFTSLEKFSESTLLVITDLAHYSEKGVEKNSNAVYKFHPKDMVSEKIEVMYIEEKIPLEIIPLLLPNLKKIRFEVMSSSILNILSMDLDVEIEIAFIPDNKPVKNMLNFINAKFAKRIEYKS